MILVRKEEILKYSSKNDWLRRQVTFPDFYWRPFPEYIIGL